MTKMIDYKKVIKKEVIEQKKAIQKMFELLKNNTLDKNFNISKEELIMQGKK